MNNFTACYFATTMVLNCVRNVTLSWHKLEWTLKRYDCLDFYIEFGIVIYLSKVVFLFFLYSCTVCFKLQENLNIKFCVLMYFFFEKHLSSSAGNTPIHTSKADVLKWCCFVYFCSIEAANSYLLNSSRGSNFICSEKICEDRLFVHTCQISSVAFTHFTIEWT